jgi:hypothetical protein
MGVVEGCPGCILGVNKKYNLKEKGPMGVVEGCPGYWGRDSNCHGYCGQHIWILHYYTLLMTIN